MAGLPSEDIGDFRGSGYFDSTQSYASHPGSVDPAETLQDFRRKQEGHLIIVDDRPILVMAFGSLYEGKHKAKYKIEGNKYDIPVGYKVIIKWEEDEIVFMTRQGASSPEFQIVYLPKSPVPDEFKLFPWNAAIYDLWDQFCTDVLETREDRSMKMFTQGPWKCFGVTLEVVQTALKQGADAKKNVDGVLDCEDGNTPNLAEHMKYLGFAPETDENYVWVCQAFKDEPLCPMSRDVPGMPKQIEQWVKEGMTYWVYTDKYGKQEATWKHPHYDKYRKMLLAARAQRPLPHWKSIMEFRIQFLLDGVYTWEVEISKQYPPVETVENVLEMARVFGEDIRTEPFLVHVLKRALRHYGIMAREKRRVTGVEDFRIMMQRYRELIGQYQQTRDEEVRETLHRKVCVHCPEEEKKDAVLYCDDCKDFLCQGCFDWLHCRGRRQNHRRTWVQMGMCAECQETVALFHCVQCSDLYCRDCFAEWHVRGGRRNHIPIVLRAYNESTRIQNDSMPAMGTGAGQEIAKAKSHWFAFYDENNVRFFYNFKERIRQTHMPLAVINEPINDNTGGGLAGIWGGSWQPQMFPDPLDSVSAMQAGA